MDSERSNEAHMSGRGDGGALVRVERRRNRSDEEKLAILKETGARGDRLGGGPTARHRHWPALHLGASSCCAERLRASCRWNWHRLRHWPKPGNRGGSRFAGGAA